jgi:hypothetical protein
MELTPKETDLIIRIAESEYHSGLTEATWTECVCESRSDSAIVGSLLAKGMIGTTQPSGPKSRIVGGMRVSRGDEATIWLTEAGASAYLATGRPDPFA